MEQLIRGRVITPEAEIGDGVVAGADGLITWVGPAAEVPADWADQLPPAAPDRLVLPGLVGVATALVPVAALCVGVTMVGAMVVHARRSEWNKVLMPLVLLVLAAFVTWGRWGPWPL